MRGRYKEDDSFRNFFERIFKHSRHRSDTARTNRGTFRHTFKRGQEEHTIRRWKNKGIIPKSKLTAVPQSEHCIRENIRVPELRVISGESRASTKGSDYFEELNSDMQYDYREEPSLDDIANQNSIVQEFPDTIRSSLVGKRQNLGKKGGTRLSRAALVVNSNYALDDERATFEEDSASREDFIGLGTNTTYDWYRTQVMRRLESSVLSFFKPAHTEPPEQSNHRSTVKGLFDDSASNAEFDNPMSMLSFSHIPTGSIVFATDETSPYGKHAKYFI